MTAIYKEVHARVDRITERQAVGLKNLLAAFPSRFAALLRNAPESDEPETEEEARLVAEARDWLRQNGGRGIPHEEVMRERGLD